MVDTAMTKLDVYNQALSLLDLSIDSLSENTKERRLLDLNYEKVVQFVLKAWDFPFLIKKVEFSTDDLTDDVWKYEFGYNLPSDFGYAVQLNGSKDHAFSIRFGVLWTDIADPVLEYMPNDVEAVDGVYTAPADFLSLIAYQLALHAAPMLDPESQAMGVAAQLYQLTLQSIMENETRSNDRPQRYEAAELFGEPNRFDLAEYRRQLFEAQR
jgi:hypothetical protein